jgi:lysophospholipase L1-like esterase
VVGCRSIVLDRLRRLLPSLALLVASALLTLLATEGAFRLAHVSVGTVQINRGTVRRSANPILLYELRPGSVVRAEVEYRINADGLRGPELPADEARRRKRIAVLGDSIAFGYWVAEQDTFPRQLETLLRRAGTDVDVLNFGVPGYNLEQEVEALRLKALSFDPDAIVIGVCLNDLDDIFSYEYGLTVNRAQRTETWAGRVADRVLQRSVLFSWIEYRRAELETRRFFAQTKNPHGGQLYAEAVDRQKVRLVRAFREVARLLAPRRVPALVAVFPTFGNRFENYPHRDLHNAVISAAEEAGLLTVDLLGCYEAYTDLRFWELRTDVVHPSPMGHRVAAHGIADALCARRVVCEAGRPEGDCRAYRREDFPTVRAY